MDGLHEDTIFAPSTAIGGAIAVIRVSGPAARRTVELLDRDVCDAPRMLQFAHLTDGGETVDDVMAVYFSAPRSYTGEDMVEINCHGGAQTVRRILELLTRCGFRPAEAGEFTKRAFLNGKMDLSQAEAVMDVVTASAERSRKAAIRQLHGSVGQAVASAENLLLDALSGIDAAIDYPDEAEQDCIAQLPALLQRAQTEITDLAAHARRGRVLRDGIRTVLLGRPNVGKSSLMNAMVGYERAIVTAAAGTTRDLLDEQLSVEGVPVRLIDTAGLRTACDEAERIGVDRARQAMQDADVLLILLDGSAALTPEDETLLSETAAQTRLIVQTKADLPHCFDHPGAIAVSAKTGDGIARLKAAIAALCAPAEEDGESITNERHLRALEAAAGAVESAMHAPELDCAATDIRSALHFLGSITGTDVDADVIDRIFANFCVGK